MRAQIDQKQKPSIESNGRDGSQPQTQPLSAVLWCLRLTIGLQCVGVAGRYLFSPNESESDIFGVLFFDVGWPEKLAQQIDDGGAWACFVSAIVLIACGFVSHRQPSNGHSNKIGSAARCLECTVLLFVATWAFLLAAAHMVRGEVFAEYALGEQAVRFATPLVMILFLRSSAADSKFFRAATAILALAAASTFAVHGYAAQQLHGPFVDLILLTDMRIFHFGFEQTMVETSLGIIGWADMIVAGLLLLTRWRTMALYMFTWGLITAASRMTAFGAVAWPETLIRAANAGAPLVLLLIYQSSKSKNG